MLLRTKTAVVLKDTFVTARHELQGQDAEWTVSGGKVFQYCYAAKGCRDTATERCIPFSVSAMVNSHVPLPVCTGVDLCAVSHLLKAYLGNRPLRLGLTCGRSRFRLRSTLPLCCKSGEMPVHYRHNRILTGMFDSFSPASCFCQGGDRYLKPEVRHWLHSYPGCSLFSQTSKWNNTKMNSDAVAWLFHNLLVFFPA